MFGIVAPIVIALMRAVYGFTTNVVAGFTTPVNTVVGPFQVQHTDGTNRFRFVPGTPEAIWDSGATIEWRTAALATRSAGLKRIADNVLGLYGAAGTTDPAWMQQSAGRLTAAANQTVTDSVALVNATGFSATLIAGRTYSFTGRLFVTTISTSGVKIDFNGGTATATAFNGAATFKTASAVAVVQTAALATSLGSTAVVLEVEVAGTITVNAAGTFILRFAQNAETGAAESVILLRGSFLMMDDMP